MNQNIVTEIVEFKLVSEISDERFINVVDSLERNFHSKQSGFIDTELSKGNNNQWTMIQHWGSMEEVRKVVQLMMIEPSTEEFRHSIDPKSVKMLLLEQVKTWGKEDA